ncbi:MAG TPA: acyl carrier protein [Candidatus Eubacterium faecigallinarum]|nr:acyl carrier protein [Candidatus Eubacterium faecigallinarum]
METLLEILEDIRPDVDFKNCNTLIDDHILDSLAIISLIAEIEDEFDITIPTVEIAPRNFNSANAIWDMIKRLQEDDE